MTKRSTNRKTKSKLPFIIAGIAIVLIGLYGFRSTHFAKHFLPNTSINNIDVSNMTVSEANKQLKNAFSDKQFTITEDGQTWKAIALTDLGFKSDFTEELTDLLHNQNSWSWGASYVSADDNASIDTNTVDQKTFDGVVAQIKDEVNNLNKDRTITSNAKIELTNTGFVITPEVIGDSIDVEAVAKHMNTSVAEGETELELEDFRAKAVIGKDDPELNKKLEQSNAIAQVKATYKINGETFVIPTETITSWLTFENDKVGIQSDLVRGYVEQLGADHNTSTNSSQFKSTRRGEVTVPAGTLSWTIQTDTEAAALEEAILAGKDFTRSPIVQGVTTADQALIGNTYIEVDLENQHMWLYKDGAVALETPIVSGKPSTPTPPGVFYVWSKERDTVLRGQNDDGTDYESPVSYWMPIDWTGVGIHDSPWQPEYGGDLWKTRGSHGCVNTPPDVMSKLFNLVEVGIPVIVF